MIARRRIWVAFPTRATRRCSLTGRPNMLPINLAWFVHFGGALDALVRSNDVPNAATARSLAARAKPYLDEMLKDDNEEFPFSLPASRANLENLSLIVEEIISANDLERTIEDRWRDLRVRAISVRSVVLAELTVQNIFFVSEKRAYDIGVLITDGTMLFSRAVQNDFNSEEEEDIKQAAKCIAFEVPTAAGFHIFRAMESVIRRYYCAVIGTLPKPKMRNWGILYYQSSSEWSRSENYFCFRTDQRSLPQSDYAP
jgi:hypothetical protein